MYSIFSIKLSKSQRTKCDDGQCTFSDYFRTHTIADMDSTRPILQIEPKMTLEEC